MCEEFLLDDVDTEYCFPFRIGGKVGPTLIPRGKSFVHTGCAVVD